MACLASRFPYGQRLTPESLSRVEAAEDFLTAAGCFSTQISLDQMKENPTLWKNEMIQGLGVYTTKE